MRRAARIPMRWAAIGALAGVAALAACQQADSILLVEVGGDLTLMPSQLVVTVSAGGQTHQLLVPPAPKTISLPTSFTVELDRSITGPVTITISATDDSGNVIGSGAATQTYINTGGQTIIAVMLASGGQP